MATRQINIRVMLRSEQTNDQLSVIRNVLPPGFGPPLHHHDFDETFYVLEGELVFDVDGERITAQAGDIAFAPRNVVHTVANLSDAPAHYLLVCTPGGFERYFDKLAARQLGTEPRPEAMKPYPETTVVGPPLG